MRGNCGSDERCVAYRGQGNKPRPVCEVVQGVGGHFEGKARLAVSTRTGESHQSAPPHQLPDRLNLRLTTYDLIQTNREVVRSAVHGGRWGKRASQARATHLVGPLESLQALQTM